MKYSNWFYTIRWKLILISLGCMAFTLLVVRAGFSLGTYLMANNTFNPPVKWIINHVGSMPAGILAGAVLFIASFFIVTAPIIKQLEQIDASVRGLAAGQYHTPITNSRATDELDRIERSLHELGVQLSQDLEELTAELQEIATGQFDRQLPAKPAHRLGTVAESINRMTKQLSHSLEEERRAEKTKNDLITGVSHDLRTPLTSVLGFLEAIENDRYQDEVELRYFVNIAYEKALSLKQLIDNLFEYTRLNNGMPLSPAPINLAAFLRQLAEEFVPLLEQAKMRCEVIATCDEPQIYADGDLLARAYENLISNAVKYGQRGERITITLRIEGGYAVVEVVNYGDPIPEKDLPYVFDRFYRVEASRSKQTGGTGLGLAITKSIIELHQGRIAAESGEEATRFITWLPLAGPKPLPNQA